MPPTRREQIELDELLSDIYKGIEALPDKQQQQQSTGGYSTSRYKFPEASNKSLSNAQVHSYSVKEYELPATSPLVKQHKQEIASLRNNNLNSTSVANKQPQRSTIKRYTNNTPELLNAHSLTSRPYVTSTTPENKRRVRIVEHPEKLAKGYTSNAENGGQKEQEEEQQEVGKSKKNHRIKYVNTNKLIYHQEKEPGDEDADEDDDDVDDGASLKSNSENNSDDIDGVTHVQYYHTNWLDRQLGRASKRRSSKELNERQVKEKAMIEELKRSLKNGAITLRQSLKGKKHNKNKPSETYDDQILGGQHRVKESSVFGSGLATIPRNYHHDNSNNFLLNQENNNIESRSEHRRTKSYKEQPNTYTANTTSNQPNRRATDYMAPVAEPTTIIAPNSTSNYLQSTQRQQTNYSSQTLPHNHQSKHQQHQLLQSHYKENYNTLNTTGRPSATASHQSTNTYINRPTTDSSSVDKMHRNTHNNCNSTTTATFNNFDSLKRGQQSLNQQTHPQLGNTISSIPSATEVVRSALSRSSSQVSLNQLNKTINLLPNSPSPYAPSPMTPTQQLRAASPSLSPSPVNCMSPSDNRRQINTNTYYHSPKKQQNTQFSSKTLGNQQLHSQDHQQQQRFYGTRNTPIKEPQPQPQRQPVYANPHVSLMQHKTEQQMREPSKNNASIREFNELDNLLRSLSPHSSVQVTPGFTSKPAQPSFGYGIRPNPQPQQQPNKPAAQVRPTVINNNNSSIYAQVQKQPVDSLTLDVSNKKDMNCLDHQELSEFEPSVEILPSMEDYQNITKLNPVKNHYWYKPNMSRDVAICLLKDKPQGTFIVRDSTSFKGAYGLAVKVAKLPKNVYRNPNADPSAELIRHFLIEPTANGVKLKGYTNEPVFGSLPALIYQHSLTELALPCRLLIPRADIEDERFNYKQKEFFDEFASSKEQAKYLPYERTSPDGGFRVYPGDVKINNEHRIIFQ